MRRAIRFIVNLYTKPPPQPAVGVLSSLLVGLTHLPLGYWVDWSIAAMGASCTLLLTVVDLWRWYGTRHRWLSPVLAGAAPLILCLVMMVVEAA